MARLLLSNGCRQCSLKIRLRRTHKAVLRIVKECGKEKEGAEKEALVSTKVGSSMSLRVASDKHWTGACVGRAQVKLPSGPKWPKTSTWSELTSQKALLGVSLSWISSVMV